MRRTTSRGPSTQSWQMSAAGRPVVPEVDYRHINDGQVSDATRAAIRKTGCVVVRGVFPESVARGWFAELGEYLDANGYEQREVDKRGLDKFFAALKAGRPQIFNVYWSKPQVHARQDPKLAETRAFLNHLWRHEGLFDPDRECTYADRVRRHSRATRRSDSLRTWTRARSSAGSIPASSVSTVTSSRATGAPTILSTGPIAWTLARFPRRRCAACSAHIRAGPPSRGRAPTTAPAAGPHRRGISYVLLRALQDDVAETDLCGAAPGRALGVSAEWHPELMAGVISIPEVQPATPCSGTRTSAMPSATSTRAATTRASSTSARRPTVRRTARTCPGRRRRLSPAVPLRISPHGFRGRLRGKGHSRGPDLARPGADGFLMDAVRPIELAEIRDARERIAGTIVRTPMVRLELGPASRHPAQTGEPAADQRLQVARRRQRRRDAARVRATPRRVDDQRGQCRAGRRLRGTGRPACRAPSWRLKRRPPPSSIECGRSARHSSRCRTRRLEGARRARPIPEWKARSCTPSTTTTSSPATRRWASRSSRTRRHRGGDCRHRRRRAHHGSAAPSRRWPEIQIWGAEPETAAPAALSFAMGSPQVFPDWKASFVDGAGGQSVFPRMWERMRPLVDGSSSSPWTRPGGRCG